MNTTARPVSDKCPTANNCLSSQKRERKRKRERFAKDEEREKSEWRILAYQIVFVITVITVRRGSRGAVLPSIDKLLSRAEFDMNYDFCRVRRQQTSNNPFCWPIKLGS